jgi:hypothetical protein
MLGENRVPLLSVGFEAILPSENSICRSKEDNGVLV